MFCAVILKNSLQNKLIPVDWIKDLTTEEIINDGIDTQKIHIVYSGPHGTLADFNHPITKTIANTVADDGREAIGCYEAFIIACFSKSTQY